MRGKASVFDCRGIEGYNFLMIPGEPGQARLNKEDGVKYYYGMVLVIGLFLGACGGNPYLDASLDPAEMEGKHQSWFEENWGKPSGKSARFFGGETWVYSRIAGGETRFPFFNFSPNKCQIILDFDKEGNLDDYEYTDC